jgi:hypothetical protein
MESEKTVYTFQDEMLDEHTGSFGAGPAFSYQFLCAALFLTVVMSLRGLV